MNEGGTVYVFSTMHVSGQQLQQVSGVAAILRYPLPDLDELEDLAAMNNDVEDYESDEELTEEERQRKAEARMREEMNDMGF